MSIKNLSRPIALSGAFIFLSLIFLSCSHKYYAPNSANVPLFKHKGESRLFASYSVGEEISGAEIQGATAIGKHVGIIFNTAFLGAGKSGNGFIIEGGAGYYKALSNKIVFETYGGVGFGGAKNNYSEVSSSKVGFTKCFIQPSIGFRSKYFDVGLVTKVSGLFMHVRNYTGVPESYDLNDINFIKANPDWFLLEPSVFFRFGVDPVKAQLQIITSASTNGKQLNQEETIISLGLFFSIKPPKEQGQKNQNERK